MRPPCELVVKEFLPALRALVANELRSLGKSQTEISKLLGVTQPAVHSYIRLYEKLPLSKIYTEEVVSLSKRISSGLVSRKLSEAEAIKAICELCTSLKCQGLICNLHKDQVSTLRKEFCDICIQLYSKGLKEVDIKYEVLNDLRAAIDVVQGSKEFAEVMPEVHVNIVSAIPRAKSIYDVAAIPGRITKVEGWPRAFMPPEFGASKHMANVLLEAMKVEPSIRAAINIAYNRKVEAAITKLGLSIRKVVRSHLPPKLIRDRDAVLYSIKLLSEKGEKMPDVFIDEGGYWIEPITYIFGPSASYVAKKAIEVAKQVLELKR